MTARRPSLEPSGDAVKKTRLARAFEGWQLGAIVAAAVVSAALLAVPRARQPDLFPLPLVDVAEDRAFRARVSELSGRAERNLLPFETRAVGDGVRRLGLALARVRGDVDHQRRVLAERVAAALAARQQDKLLELRALQATLFVRAVRAQDFGAEPAPELAALGGDFVARAVRSGWAGPSGCLASDEELLTLFGLRFVELTGLGEQPGFEPTLSELRRYYRFLLLYPPGGAASPEAQRSARLALVSTLARRDPDYPGDLARGVLLGALGASEASADAHTAHLGRSGGAFWNLRARNYLLGVASEHIEAP